MTGPVFKSAPLRESKWGLAALVIYSLCVVLLLYYHEPWADEAEAWLLARDSALADLLTDHLRYQGHASLWYLILMLPAKLGAPYYFMKFISGLFAIAGVYVLLRFSPFPLGLKLLLPFSYFVFYQYAVISRPYILLPLLLFCIAAIYDNRIARPGLYLLLLCLLADVSGHGFIVAASLLLLYTGDAVSHCSQLTQKHKHTIAAGIGISMFVLALIALQSLPLQPTPWFSGERISINTLFTPDTAVLFCAFLSRSLVDNIPISLLLMIPVLLWFYHKKLLLLYFVPTIALFFFFRLIIYKGWHSGIPFLLLVFALWISFSEGRKTIQRSISGILTGERNGEKLKSIVVVTVVAILLRQIAWSGQASYNDINGPYSAGQSVAHYIKSEKLQDKKIYATGYWSTSILPYFDRIIFNNFKEGKSPSVWIWRGPMHHELSEMVADEPDLIILSTPEKYSKAVLQGVQGYRPVGPFNGHLFFKNGIYEKNDFLLLRKRPKD